MIDPKRLREEFENIASLLKYRGAPENFSSWPELDRKRRELLGEIESIRSRKNSLNPEIAKAKKESRDTSELIAELKQSGEREKSLNEQLSQVKLDLEQIELLLPNIPDESVPEGEDENANRLEKTWGEKPDFDFKPKAHWEIGEQLGILDFEMGAKVSGARFTVYRGAGARLERALANFMLDRHIANGYQEIIPPFLVREASVRGSGQLPKFEDDLFQTANFEPKLFLIPTAEVPLCNLHADEILSTEELPKSYVAFTPCFRAEAGSHGRDVRGLIRQHQFHKVELVKITTPETSFDELEKLTRDAESILEELELPYQRLTLSSGDMGLAAAKTFDLEVWLPGLDEYREISSCSNTLDFQSRRTKTRYRANPKEKPQLVHMLNGSGLAVGRTLLAVLENYQQKDGSVRVPKALQAYMGGQEAIS